eukprot:3529173-Rhodomonas_salina.1
MLPLSSSSTVSLPRALGAAQILFPLLPSTSTALTTLGTNTQIVFYRKRDLPCVLYSCENATDCFVPSALMATVTPPGCQCSAVWVALGHWLVTVGHSASEAQGHWGRLRVFLSRRRLLSLGRSSHDTLRLPVSPSGSASDTGVSKQSLPPERIRG